jgi:hypothetical protein
VNEGVSNAVLADHLIFLCQPASLLTFIVYALTQHPNVADRLRQEIIEKVGLTNPPTHEDIKHMKYTRAIVNGKFSFLDTHSIG